MAKINFIMKNITKNKLGIYSLMAVILFISCEKSVPKNENAVCSFQNLVCFYTKDSIEIKNVESFLLFGNSTNDTIKISLKNVKKNYRHVFEKDTFEINFEALNPISIPPHDSLGLPCVSAVGKKFNNKSIIFKKGFNVVDIQSQKIISNASDYKLEQVREFQLYKKWGRKNNDLSL